MSEPVSYPTIFELMGHVLNDLPAIGKDSKAPAIMGGYAFRGIDGVLNALNPILSTYGVFYLPTVVERTDSVRKTKAGADLFVTCLRVRYRFYGPAGDFVECEVWGEGSDSGDKATQKAMTGAQKYMLFQVFCISTEEAANMDIDRGGEVDTRSVKSPLEERKEAFLATGEALPEGWKTYEEFDEAHELVKRGLKSMDAGMRATLIEYRKLNDIPWPMDSEQMTKFLNAVMLLRKGEDILATTSEQSEGDSSFEAAEA